ncbi:hypothetical protein ACRS7P_25240 [Pseudomonas aeruginosa]|uniref:hypothetical protein n=1 Tax=Pseudomonas aeruginosa TaxID=287 RepID=UPI0038BEC872
METEWTLAERIALMEPSNLSPVVARLVRAYRLKLSHALDDGVLDTQQLSHASGWLEALLAAELIDFSLWRSLSAEAVALRKAAVPSQMPASW